MCRFLGCATAAAVVLVWLFAAGCDRSSTTAPSVEQQRSPARSAQGDASAGEALVAATRPEAGRFRRPQPAPIDPATTRPDPQHLLVAKERYERVVPRTTLASWQRFSNLVYEANNMDMRGPRTHDGGGPYATDGRKIAATWRKYARGVRALFVLRDSLYSQQDHPYLHDPYAPLLPPNWVTAVAHAADTGEPFEPMRLPQVDDDEGWQSIESPQALFGDLPASDSLFEAATASFGGAEPPAGADARARNARRTLHILQRDLQAMVAVIDDGPDAVAKVGAERIAQSDRAYFGQAVRRDHIIPLFVEHPNAKEIQEGKGLELPGQDVSKEVLQTCLRRIYSRRLADGDMAIERYDLSEPDERERAISVLEVLIPESGQEADAAHSVVWLWVTGKLDPHKKLRGEDARGYVAKFREELEAADVDTNRLELFSKPTVELPDDGFEAALARELASFERLDMPMSINLPTSAKRLRDVLCCQ